jgi:hypothetical protein
VVGDDAGRHGRTLVHAVRSIPTFLLSIPPPMFFSSTCLYSAKIAPSNKLNNTSAVAASVSLEEHTNPSSLDTAQSRFGWLWHHAQAPPFILAHDIPRGILQIVIASINFLLMLTVM